MDWVNTETALGTTATGVSAVAALYFWGRGKVREMRAERNTRLARNWNGFIIREGVNTWLVRVVEDESEKWSERVIFDVVNHDGTPNESMAHLLRMRAREDGMLSRSPTPEQWDFLQDLRKARFGAPGGYPIS